jgi:hypothetical protein
MSSWNHPGAMGQQYGPQKPITASFRTGYPLGFLTKTYRRSCDAISEILQKEIRAMVADHEKAVQDKARK